jgi:hypothetical protein
MKGGFYQTIQTPKHGELVTHPTLLYSEMKHPTLFMEKWLRRPLRLENYINQGYFGVVGNQIYYRGIDGRFYHSTTGQPEDVTPDEVLSYDVNGEFIYLVQRRNGISWVSYNRIGRWEDQRNTGTGQITGFTQISRPTSAIPINGRLPMEPIRRSRIVEKYLQKFIGTYREILEFVILEVVEEVRFYFEWNSPQLPVFELNGREILDLTGTPRDYPNDPVELMFDRDETHDPILVRLGSMAYITGSNGIVGQAQVSDIPIPENYIVKFDPEFIEYLGAAEYDPDAIKILPIQNDPPNDVLRIEYVFPGVLDVFTTNGEFAVFGNL